ncbi:MAG: dTDP-4-amino-4,6-dideoxygalactose transaminase [Phycisphaeraceae bacterium]
MTSRVPFNRASLTGRELEYIQKAVEGGHISGDGPFTRACQSILEQETGARKALLTTSCTHALEMAAFLLDIKPGDEVIVPSFTFVSTANAFAVRGARIVFADIRPDTLNLDETKVRQLITPRTRAIVPVHYAGVACEMDELLAIANESGIALVEDNAHGLFGRYRGRPLGSFGCMSTLSFHETKNITCGEGGALLINDERFIDRAEIIREKGTNRSRFFRGQVDKYTWVDLGSSYLPSDILAAFLLAQLESRETIQVKRRQIWERYHAALQEWANAHRVRQPVVPDHCQQAYHLYYLLLPSRADRDSLIEHLAGCDILSVFHYVPLHLSKVAMDPGGAPADCPITEDVSDRLLRLPCFVGLTESDQARVVEAVTTWLPDRLTLPDGVARL